MVDPVSAIGLAASVAQLVEVVFKIATTLETIKEGGKEREKLREEVTSKWLILRQIEMQFAPLESERNEAWTKHIDSLAEHGGIFEELATALQKIWSKITESETWVGKVVQTLRWPYDKRQVDMTIDLIERLKTSVTMVTSQTTLTIAQKRRGESQPVTKIVIEDQLIEILNWLSPLNSRQTQERFTRALETGDWFFHNEEFEIWHSGDEPCLWCYGIPGAGKSVLASTVVDKLRRRCVEGNENIALLAAFCSFDSSDSQSVDYIICSLLKQVIQQTSHVPKQLNELFRERNANST
ncbi:MAG: hypothetical protein M1816_004154 [Peltula sp. TS41687]|nr:MAG: hypothetical protein M1816_004154 [Peltula sp. TS41687]